MRDKSKEPVAFMWSVLLAPLIIRNKHHHQQTVDWYKNFSRHHQRTKQVEGLLWAIENFLSKTERKPDVLRLCCMTDPKELKLVMEALFPLWESYELQTTMRERLKKFNRWKTDQMVTPVVTGSDLKGLGYQDGPGMGIWLETAFQMQLEGVSKEDLMLFFQRISHKQTSD
jgi:hypothetical protein